jgi:molybdate/tungstate transport system substrate-binding protein
VVQNLLVPRHAAFNIRFATNEMVIAYTGRSRFRGELTAENWPEVLLRPGVAFGRSDPNRDPCGYRTEMLFQLAERHYGRPGLARRLAAAGGRRFMRPKETDLLALLEAGEIDYLFIYRSVAVQHRLKVLTLPAPINLRSPALAAQYRRASVKVTGREPGEVLTRVGEPIVYSVTIPQSAQNRGLALDYLALLLSAEGRAVMARNGQTPLSPALASGAVPPRLRPFCQSEAPR